jgi:sugar phosphate isomerase/epimerase
LLLKDFLQKAKSAGYNGVEYGIASKVSGKELETIFHTTEQYGLDIIAQHFDTTESNFELHKIKYAQWFEKLKPFRPYKINTQTGKDFFTLEQNCEIIAIAESFARETGLEVVHETHRSKFAFAAHVTKQYLEAVPGIKLALDISHWVNVAESYLEDQQEAVELAITHAEHIHARVGYPEGPQITDPRLPEWQDAVSRHIAWWDKIAERKRTEGRDTVLTITPEFGPYPYMVHLPFTNQPITSQWEVNEYMMNLLRKKYGGL